METVLIGNRPVALLSSEEVVKCAPSKVRMEVAEVSMEMAKELPWYSNRSADRDRIVEFAETIYENIREQVDETNPSDMIFRRVQGAYGKQIKAHQLKGGRYYERTYGGHMRETSLDVTEHTVTTKPGAVHISAPIEQLKAGMLTTADIVESARRAVIRHKLDLIWNTLTTAIATSSSYATDIGASLTRTELATAVEAVADRTQPGAGLIWGRRSLLSPIWSFSSSAETNFFESMSNDQKDEIKKKGVITGFQGVAVLPVAQWTDERYGDTVIPATSIFVTPEDKQFSVFVEVDEHSDNETRKSDQTFHLYIIMEDGAAFWMAEYARRLYTS